MVDMVVFWCVCTMVLYTVEFKWWCFNVMVQVQQIVTLRNADFAATTWGFFMVKHGGFRLSLPGFLAPSLGRDRTCCASLSSMHEIYWNITIEYCRQLEISITIHIFWCVYIWLVVWNIWIIFPYIGNSNPNWRTHIFQMGRLNHQPDIYILFIFIDYYSIAINPQGSNIHSSRNRFRIQVQAFHRNTNWTFPCDFTLTKPVTKKLGDTGEDLATAVFFFGVASCCGVHAM